MLLVCDPREFESGSHHGPTSDPLEVTAACGASRMRVTLRRRNDGDKPSSVPRLEAEASGSSLR